MSLDALQCPTLAKLPVRSVEPRVVVIHGSGETDIAKLMDLYTRSIGPHYLITLDGGIRQFAQEARVAWHCKIEPAERALYATGWNNWCEYIWNKETNAPEQVGEEFPGYATWRKLWREGHHLNSPLELLTGAKPGDPNNRSIGIELQSPVNRGRFIYTDAQYAKLGVLLCDINKRRPHIRLERGPLLAHSDVSPMRRCTAHAGAYDPGEQFSWNTVFDLVSGA